MTDVTEAALLQPSLRIPKKMAALATGVRVAHEVIIVVGDHWLHRSSLGDPELPESAGELGVILQEAERTRLIVQNMLRFAREVPPQREPVQVNVVPPANLEVAVVRVSNRNVEIVERLAENLPVVVADRISSSKYF